MERGKEDMRFWQGSPTALSAASLPPFCFPSLPAFSSHEAPALIQHQTWFQGCDSTLNKQVLSSCSPVTTAASHLWDSLQQDFQMHSWMVSWGQCWPTLMVFAGTAQI